MLSYTIIFERKRDDVAIILGETADGERFLAHSAEADTVHQMREQAVTGRSITVEQIEGRNQFRFKA